ncbi:MAG TPA: hypothetical protein VF535_12090 [Allosphingosinicella sp.]
MSERLDINAATKEQLDGVEGLAGHGHESSATAKNAAASRRFASSTRCRDWRGRWTRRP